MQVGDRVKQIANVRFRENPICVITGFGRDGNWFVVRHKHINSKIENTLSARTKEQAESYFKLSNAWKGKT